MRRPMSAWPWSATRTGCALRCVPSPSCFPARPGASASATWWRRRPGSRRTEPSGRPVAQPVELDELRDQGIPRKESHPEHEVADYPFLLARECLLLDLVELGLADRALVEERLCVGDLSGGVAGTRYGLHVLVHLRLGCLLLTDRPLGHPVVL